jgi:iron complex transport system ATP-binding protein
VAYLAQDLPPTEGLSVADLVRFGRYPWRGLLGRMTERDGACVEAALDVAHQVEVMDLIRRLGRDLDLGVVVVLHDINMASRYCDEIVALKDGALLTHGAPGELMAEARLEALYDIPMRVLPHPTQDHRIAVVMALLGSAFGLAPARAGRARMKEARE